jgi:nitroreductase
MSSQIHDAILGLRVSRKFTTEPVGTAELGALLEAARWTGSSKNRQDWAFVVLTGDDRERVAAAGRFTAPLRNAPLGIALVRLPGGNDFDVGRVAQNIMLTAASLGLGSCPVTLHEEAAAAAALGLPDDHQCRWVIALGHIDAAAEEGSRAGLRERGMSGRRPLSELVHRGRFQA